MVQPIIYNDTYYMPRSEKDQMAGFVLASIASGAIMKGLSVTGDVFHRELVRQQKNNDIYKTYLDKAMKLSELDDIVKIIPAQKHPGRFPIEAKGENAFFSPTTKEIVLNTEKISHAGFHELGHAMNDLKSKYGVKYLAKMRYPGYLIAGLMEYFSVFSRTKPKEAKRNIKDYIEDNCGKIAFAAMTPVIAEEAIASYRGVKIAKKAGLSEPLINNLKKLYKKALSTYVAHAALLGLAIGASRMIMDYFTRPRKIDSPEFSFWG